MNTTRSHSTKPVFFYKNILAAIRRNQKLHYFSKQNVTVSKTLSRKSQYDVLSAILHLAANAFMLVLYNINERIYLEAYCATLSYLRWVVRGP